MSQTNINLPGNGSSGMSACMIIGVVLAIIVLGAVAWYLLSQGASGSPTPGSVKSILESVLPAPS